MKTKPYHIYACLIRVLAAVFLAIGYATASTSIVLSVDLKSNHGTHSSKSAPDENHRWLEISASAMGLESPTQITLEWTFFADDLGGGKAKPHAKGSETVQLTRGEVVEVKTKDTVFSYVREHAEKVSGGRRVTYKKVAATGSRFHGWAVRAFIGTELVGEAYSSRDITGLLSETGTSP
jgi:hypothetical protein